MVQPDFDDLRAGVTNHYSRIIVEDANALSAVTFYGGAEGSARWSKAIEDVAGIPLCTGAQSLIAAFNAHGGIRKIAALSPYYPVANAEVANFMSDHGVTMVRDTPLLCPSWTAIAEVPATLVEKPVTITVSTPISFARGCNVSGKAPSGDPRGKARNAGAFRKNMPPSAPPGS
ncbi:MULTISPECIES: hypothetical protein [Sphingobium]|uniref:aspartate racemase/maleate isomerase family protein n=1 Tax=Sphingobium TaxID=165695 RepID=UPI001F5D2BC7|nr:MULTISPECIES: hypothetical protein [Sphingobium]WCP15457.1 hypothetical protein sphantq_03924 [Sphingobium sp. AntQ-1]